MKYSFAGIALLAASAVAAPVKLQLRASGFDFNSQKVKGVNIGGWLVLEPWIRPSLWGEWASNPASGPVDEYHWCQTLGGSCKSTLDAHWKSFYTEADFKAIHDAGLNTVRIPIGWWAFASNPSPYVNGQEYWLDQAISWARTHQLKVWVDLHGAPGSQNGFDNSGIRGNVGWQQGTTITDTLYILKKIATKYAQPAYQDVVTVIELLNEPLGVSLDMDKLHQYYQDGFGTVRDVSGTFIAISDAFKDVPSWNGVLSGGGNNVLIDHHHYQVFDEGMVSRTVDEQVGAACGTYGEIDGSDKYVVVGEFSGAMTDCARWLNGWNVGNRFEGSYEASASHGSCTTKGTISSMSAQDKADTRRFVEAQMQTYEKKNGWIFWTWKTEDNNFSDDWNFSKMLANGLAPNPVSNFQTANICG